MQVVSYQCTPTHRPPPSLRSEGERSLPARVLEAPVLVIEDETMIAWMLESILEEAGFASIMVAPDGETAIAVARDTTPGLIISDINLGTRGIDGIHAAALVRAAQPIPTIFISGYASDDAAARIGREAQGARLLRKPVRADELLRAIAALADT